LGPPELKNTEKGVPDGFFHFLTSFPFSAGAGLRPGPRWGSFASQSRRIWNNVVMGPRDNGFPGLTVALDGPDFTDGQSD